jgi:uncharacterized protein (TIGR02996 family)
MNLEQAFLKAIRLRPGSSAERLIYADWLMDQGNPRGEFMQCQLQARRLPSGSPRRLDLEAHAHDLRLLYEADWLGPLLGPIGNWEWRDGMLDWVTVAVDVFLANAARWLPALPLLGVQLRKVRPYVADLARCEQLAHLNGLYLGDNDLTDNDLDVLLRSTHLKQVRSLYLQSNHLSAQGIRILAQTPNLPHLRHLCLGHNRIGNEGVALLVSSPRLGRLRVLHLTLTGLGEEGVRALAGSALLSRLRVLTIGMNQLPPGCLTMLARVPAFAGLRALGYEMNRPNDADVAALAGSPFAAGLRHLSLDCYQTLGDAALTALASSPSLSQLRTLRLGSGSWGPIGARALGRSRTLTSLRLLQITPDEESGQIPKVLLGQPLLRRLRRLDLGFSPIGKKGLATLASHPQPLRLRELELTLSPHMAGDWEMLLSKRLLTSLTTLSLTAPPPGSLRALLEPDRLPELRRLTLRGLSDLEDFQGLLDNPLLGRLSDLRIDLSFDTAKQQGPEILRRLLAVWSTPALRRLGLLWSLSSEEVLLLADVPVPPLLTELELGSFRMKTEGMAALAGSPLLRQLRHLILSNASSQEVPGLEALAESPQVGPLLRVDIQNGHVPRAVVPALRRRFGIRFAVSGRKWPRTISLGGWHGLLGDGED